MTFLHNDCVFILVVFFCIFGVFFFLLDSNFYRFLYNCRAESLMDTTMLL